jgi:glucose/mannose-6-phosphate isomerase
MLLRDPKDDARNLKRYDVLLPLLAEKGVSGTIVDILGDTVYTRIFNTLLLGDFIAYYLALAYDQDPEPVAMVEAFKKLL